MVSEKNLKKQSTGPITALGKSRSALNALKHGGLSSKLLLPSENLEAFELLSRDITLDLRPVGAIENILVQKIVAVLWRKRRLEGAEQDALSSAEMKSVTESELQKALGLNVVIFPDWLLDEDNAPSETDGVEAVAMCLEWVKYKEQGIEPETDKDAQCDFPAHWKKLKAEVVEDGYDESIADYLEMYYQTPSFLKGFCSFMSDKQKKFRWIAYWHRNREKMAAAFRAIRVKNMLREWDLDRSHRYHTMLDNQLFKLLREFRETHAWRISNLDMVNEVDRTAPKSE